MYTQIWNKYLPVIKILIKRSAGGDQLLNLNLSDFERRGARKTGYKFNIRFKKGRADNVMNSEIAKNLAGVLLEDAVVKELFMQNEYEIAMNAKFQLSIQCIAPPLPVTAEEPSVEEQKA